MYEPVILPNTKLRKAEYLLKYPEFKPHIPETAPESRENLYRFLQSFNTVYVKPNGGTGGRGVISARYTVDGQYSYQIKETVHNFRSFDEFYNSLSRYVLSRKYLVQKGIPLLKYRNRPFDIRVMVQKNLKSEWENTGVIARVAHPNKIVTNYHQGGTVVPLEKVLHSQLNAKEIEELKTKMNRLCLHISEELGPVYPFVTAFGVDLGLDANFKPWIIEVNTRPYPYLFKHDKSVLRKIMRFIRFNRKSNLVIRRLPAARVQNW